MFARLPKKFFAILLGWARLNTGPRKIVWRRLVDSGSKAATILRCALLALCCFAGFSRAQAQPVFSTEYDIKATLLFNLVQFTEWPTNAFQNPQSPIIVGVLGSNPFGESLDKVLAGEKIQNRPVVAAYFKRLEDVRNCHVLFVSRSEAERLDAVVRSLRGRSILTVSDIDQFARRGGMLRFITEKNKVRIRINMEEVAAANLRVSSKLLRIAERVGE